VIRSLSIIPRLVGPFVASLVLVMTGARALAQTATDITGVYNTGLTSGGALAASGTQAANWSVTYVSGTGTSAAANEGAGYVISPSAVSGSGYTPDTSNAQWIVAPGASTSGSGGTLNAGGNYLPGNGNTGANEGVFVYTLAFNITGSGTSGTTVTSQIQISMTLAADDQYAVYVNPTGHGTTLPTGTAASTDTSAAWSNTTSLVLQNYGTGGANNASFKIGTNYIVVVVDNTNSVTGSSGSTALNESGLLVYESSAATINGKPVPEVATWLPLVGVIGCYGLLVLRRRQIPTQQPERI
jgi:hypothetical protein